MLSFRYRKSLFRQLDGGGEKVSPFQSSPAAVSLGEADDGAGDVPAGDDGELCGEEPVETAADVYLREREDGERFLDTYRRIGMAPFKEALYA